MVFRRKIYDKLLEWKENSSSKDNIYRLDGRVPLIKAIPFGLQHVLAMFVSNIAPIVIIAGVAMYNGEAFTAADIAGLIQNCMLIAGIGTLFQLYPVWEIGSGLPIVMGVSFTFLSVCMTAASRDYGFMIGGVLIGGCIEGLLGMLAKYWRRFISPVVSACVVIAIGLSILNVGTSSFASSAQYKTGAWQNLLVGAVTLISCLAFLCLAKGVWKQMNVLFGMTVGYIVSIAFGMVDFSKMSTTVEQLGVFSFPKLFAYAPKFDAGIIVSFIIVYMVSVVETIGDATALCVGGLNRDITDRDISGSLAVDGFISALSGGMFGVSPITSFSQNVGLIKMTHVINRFTIMTGAALLLLGGLFPPIGAFFSTLPQCVLGGCTVIMFGSILYAGIEMAAKAGFNTRNMLIIATSLCFGVGATQVEGFFDGMPSVIGDIFGSNMVAGVFVVAIVLNWVLPKKLD